MENVHILKLGLKVFASSFSSSDELRDTLGLKFFCQFILESLVFGKHLGLGGTLGSASSWRRYPRGWMVALVSRRRCH